MTLENRGSQILDLGDGRRCGFAEYGDPAGLPVLALHGTPACRLMYAAADDAARECGLRLLAPDRPGYGLTPLEAGPATLSTRTTWLRHVVDAMGLERFGVLGVSGGSPYAVALAAALGPRVSGLALVSPMGPIAEAMAAAAVPGPEPGLLQRRFFLNLSQRMWLTVPGAKLAAVVFGQAPDSLSGMLSRMTAAPDRAILARPDVHVIVREMTLEAFRQGGEGAARDLAIFGQPWNVDYAAIQSASIIWQGTADTIVPVAATLHLADRLPSCTLNLVDGAAHFWVFEHIPEVLDGLRALIGGAGARDGGTN